MSTCFNRFLVSDAGFNRWLVGVTVPIGTEANQIANVPTSYSDNDLLVYLNDGQTAGYGTPVKISGKMYYPLVGQDFVCGLENVLLEPGS